MEKHEETIGSFTGKEISEFINANGMEQLASECAEVTRDIKQLVQAIGIIVQEHAAACIVGGISFDFTLRGAGAVIMAGTLGKVVKETKEDKNNG